MAETISKHIGEGFGKGELYAALAYDSSDAFGGMKIKSVMHDTTYREYFRDSGLYIYSSADGQLDIVADTTLALSGAVTMDSTLAMGTSGTPLTTATTGLSAVKIYSDHSASGYNVPVWVTGAHTGDGATYGSMYCVRGDAKLSGTQTTQSNAQYVVGVHGRARVDGTAYNSSLFVSGVCAQLLAGGTWTAANLVYAL